MASSKALLSPLPTEAEKTTKDKKRKKPRQIWLKRVLVPFWVIQLFFMLVLVGLNAWMIYDTYIVQISTIILLTFSSLNTLLIIIEIILFARRALQPLLYLLFQCLKTSTWLALFGMSMAGLGRNARALGSSTTGNGIVLSLFTGLIEVIVVLLAFIGTLIYASVIYHRHRKHIPYHRSPSSSSDNQDHGNRYAGPFSDSEIGTVNYSSHQYNANRDSTAAPEVDREGGSMRKTEKRNFGELESEGTEVRELDSPEEEERWRKKEMAMRGKLARELEGDRLVYELSATRSVRGGGGGSAVELLGGGNRRGGGS
ncbi:MAG: hypothetical protein Q9220_002312 [cf. Caloplaca sp. 1 TL-2023]